ncbi:MAG: hypothetical protein O3C45_03800 [Bacteroidetes bacterium]|nr:hypothetical protein [Bacteroidota bacterium]MDA0874166.1 hypothetical protein [Bacteroidota bacterium]
MDKMHMTRGLLLCLVVLSTLGCEEAVDPVLSTDEAYTLYGFLDPTSDRQAIRIFSIDGVLERTRNEPMDAIVRSVNARTGETVSWRDSVVVFDDLSLGHVFHAPFRADFDTPYTLSVTASDGRSTSVDVRTPPDGEARIVDIASARSQVVIHLEWSSVPRLLQTQVSYHVRVPFPDRSDTTTTRVDIRSGRVEENGDGTWRVYIIPSGDLGIVFGALGLQPGRDPIFLDRVEVRAFVTSADWVSPVGSFDPELLVQPGTFSNVQDGFGFVGGGYFDRFEFEMEEQDERNAGFSVE